MPATIPHKLRSMLIAPAILTLVGVTLYSLVKPGNNMGIDEWAQLYRALQPATEYSDRPLALTLLTLTAPFAGTSPAAYHVISIALWIINGFLVYVNIRLLSPDRPIFALMCGILYIVYYQDDFWMLLTFMHTVDGITSVTAMLLTMAAHFAYMQGEQRLPRLRTGLLIASALLALITPLIREATVPILMGLPVIVFLLQRKFDRARWIGVGTVWLGVLLPAIRSLLPVFRIGESSYGTRGGLFTGTTPAEIVQAIAIHIDFAINPLIHVGRQRIVAVWTVIAVLALWIALGFWLNRKHLTAENASPLSARLRMNAAWIFGSAAAIWLGFAAYLPTIYADSTWRTHLLSKPGEAVLLASLIWLISDLFGRRPKWILRYLGAVYIAMAGAAMVWHIQTSLDKYGATWENLSAFMRSLPEVDATADDPILFVYMQVPNPYETPFTNGFGLQYALRYFYEDRATGIIPIDAIRGKWTVDDDGITLREDWVEGTTHFGWDEIIFIRRDDATGRVVILNDLPEEFHTVDRQVVYDPDSRTVEGTAPRIRERFGESEPFEGARGGTLFTPALPHISRSYCEAC